MICFPSILAIHFFDTHSFSQYCYLFPDCSLMFQFHYIAVCTELSNFSVLLSSGSFLIDFIHFL